MKANIYDAQGTKKGDIELPVLFAAPIREDIVAKYVEADKFARMQPYATYKEAGKRHSASGTISHRRHEWKGHYGKGISRLPRKVMWRRGVQFYWVGAEVANTRGGRRAHPPKGVHTPRKINTKERTIAWHSAFAATFNPTWIKKRYSLLISSTLNPAVVESLPSKTKAMHVTLKSIFGSASSHIFKNKEVRPGKGKLRGRKYKENAGLLIITGKNENIRCAGVEVKTARELQIADLYPLGRLTLYTKESLGELQHVA
nr:50S ribosomal protein L4P [uncultured archaeon]